MTAVSSTLRAAAAALLAAVCVWPAAVLAQTTRDAEARVLERFQAGDYQRAARLGLEALAHGSVSQELRFALANSLAWTGRYDAAIEQYQALLGTPYDNRARIGMASVMRWRGQADLAEPHYRAVLEREPGNEAARGGLALAGRDLRPALTARVSRMADNEDLSRNELGLNYRRWSEDRAWRFQVGTFGERNHSPTGNWSARGLDASVWGAGLPLAPLVEASLYDSDLRAARTFATVQLEPVRDRVRIRFGRVNWARLAFNAGAAADGLTARTLGLSANAEPGVGSVRARIDAYEVSDGNRVLDGEAQLTPWWQPLPYGVKWFGGVYARDAERADPRYWSPDPAYGVAFIGVQRGWYFERTDLTASVRRGFAFTETARNAWSFGLSTRHWLRAGFAVGLEAWAVDAPRPNPYRLYQVAAFVQQLW